jgi:hypothetical protein
VKQGVMRGIVVSVALSSALVGCKPKGVPSGTYLGSVETKLTMKDEKGQTARTISVKAENRKVTVTGEGDRTTIDAAIGLACSLKVVDRGSDTMRVAADACSYEQMSDTPRFDPQTGRVVNESKPMSMIFNSEGFMIVTRPSNPEPIKLTVPLKGEITVGADKAVSMTLTGDASEGGARWTVESKFTGIAPGAAGSAAPMSSNDVAKALAKAMDEQMKEQMKARADGGAATR